MWVEERLDRQVMRLAPAWRSINEICGDGDTIRIWMCRSEANN